MESINAKKIMTSVYNYSIFELRLWIYRLTEISNEVPIKFNAMPKSTQLPNDFVNQIT